MDKIKLTGPQTSNDTLSKADIWYQSMIFFKEQMGPKCSMLSGSIHHFLSKYLYEMLPEVT